MSGQEVWPVGINASGDKQSLTTTTEDGSPAVLVVAESVDSITGIKRYQVTPTISGVATSEQLCTCATGESLIGAIAVFNALDNVTASDAVSNRFPDVKKIEAGESITVQSSENIEKVWCVGLSTAANAGGFVIPTGAAIGDPLTAATGAEIRAELIEFTFSAADEVKTVEITLGVTAPETVLNPNHIVGTIRVEGYSHA